MSAARKTRPATSRKPAASPKPATTTGRALVTQGAKFGVVGISNTLIDYLIFMLVTTLFNVPTGQSYLVKYLSGSCAMINSFYWNRRWVFKSRADIGTSGIKFLTATLVSVWAIQPFMVHTFTATAPGLGFSTFWFHLAQSMGVTHLAPQTLTQPFVVKTVAFGMGVVGSAVWNFTMYKLWAFRDTKKPA